jgi:hypothetical protein
MGGRVMGGSKISSVLENRVRTCLDLLNDAGCFSCLPFGTEMRIYPPIDLHVVETPSAVQVDLWSLAHDISSCARHPAEPRTSPRIC